MADVHGKLLYVGGDLMIDCGYSTGAGGQITWDAISHPEDVDLVRQLWSRALKSQTRFDMEYRIRNADGSYRWCRNIAIFTCDKTPIKRSWIGFIEDIEERKRTEAQLEHIRGELIHSSRLSAMGALSVTLAHELNQPLAAVTNYVRGCIQILSQESQSAPTTVINALREADNSAVRAGDIIRQVREMVSRTEAVRLPNDAALLIDEACSLALIDAKSLDIVSDINLDLDNVYIDVDRIQIQQVIFNIIRNSIHALQNANYKRIYIKATISFEILTIDIQDSGIGIPAKLIDTIFEPFISSSKNGLGIGLAISKSIIEAHKGSIKCQNRENGGTQFILEIPCKRK
jgi:PAS domain S-box-containing protein